MTPMQNRSLKRRRLTGGVVTFILFVLGFLWFIGVFGGNVRVVDAGRYYRSAQISGPLLQNVVETYGIKSVINLRGAQQNDKAYDSEISICSASGIRHVDFDLSAYRLPPPKDIKGIIQALDELPKPVLVHCRGGADRTGLVSALYLNVYKNVALDQAEHEQLTWRYGHMAFTNTKAMDRFFDLYRSSSNGRSLRSWILETYPSIYDGEVRKHAPDVLPPKGGE